MLELSNHAFKGLDEALAALRTLLIEQISVVGQQLGCGRDALSVMDAPEKLAALVKEARALDVQVNRREFDILALVQDIVGKHTLAGADLRFVIGSIKLSTILELMADRAKNSVKRLSKLSQPPSAQSISMTRKLIDANAELIGLIKGLIDQFDDVKAQNITDQFPRVEELYRQVWEHTPADALTDYHALVMLAKNQERICDMIIDMKKIIYFVHTGHKLGA